MSRPFLLEDGACRTETENKIRDLGGTMEGAFIFAGEPSLMDCCRDCLNLGQQYLGQSLWVQPRYVVPAIQGKG
jgi:hypothetical protein